MAERQRISQTKKKKRTTREYDNNIQDDLNELKEHNFRECN